jgi:predicted TIM-barrel fold metal-dependent hydrolase
MGQPGPVDVQTHFLPSTVVAALERRTEVPRLVSHDGRRFVEYAASAGCAYPLLPEMVNLDDKLAALDPDEVAVSVLSVNIPGLDWFDPADAAVLARDVNDELIDLVHSRPDRFAAFAALPMQVPEAAAAELERSLGLGFSGAMMYSNVAGRHLDEPAFRPVFAAAAHAEAPIFMHPTYPLTAPSLGVHAFIPVLGFLFDTSTATLRLIFDGIFERHPDLTIILGHAGGVIPYLIGRIDYESSRIPGGLAALSTPPSEQIRRLYVDTVNAWSPALQMAIDFFGLDHVMFATDHPFWDPRRTHDALAALDLGPEDLEAIESGNAARVLGLGLG